MSGSQYYGAKEKHPIDPKRVMLFTIADQEPMANWYVRIRREVKGKGRYFQQSLKTTSLPVAMEKAKKLYLDLLETERKGDSFETRRFNATFNAFLRDLAVSPQRRTRFTGVFRRYFSVFFKDVELSQITTAQFNNYLRWRSNYWNTPEAEERRLQDIEAGIPTYHTSKRPTERTLNSEKQMLRQFLFWCEEKRYIQVVPSMKVRPSLLQGVNTSKERRKSKALDEELEGKIERSLRRYCLGDLEGHFIRDFSKMRLYYFTYWARHTLIRPSTELTHLRWRDIEIINSKQHEGKKLALIRVLNAKGGKERMAVMPYGQVPLIIRWRELTEGFNRLHPDVEFGLPHHYVFPSYKGGDVLCETHLIGRLFRRHLASVGLDKDQEGRTITLYSVARHTAITRRIERSNWDVGRVAASAGTSIQQISTSYYEAFIRQNPDRWAMTFKKGVPYLSEKKQEEIDRGVERWEKMLEGFDEIG